MQTRSASPRHGQNAPMPRRPLVLALAVMLVIAAVAFGLGMLAGSGQNPPPAQQQAVRPAAAVVLTAATATCKTTASYTYSVSSAGTVRQEWTRKIACGSRYQKWEYIGSRSRTGAHYTESVYRDERSYPLWWQNTVKHAWSATGTYTITITTASGG